MGRRWLSPGAAIAAITVVGLLAGCTSSSEEDPTASPPETVELGGDDVELVSALLQRYDSCDAFLADVKAEALERVGPYGLGNQHGYPIGLGGGDGRMAFAEAGDDMADSAGSAPAPTATGTDPAFSGTNLQEQGVDEPDLVKTDGTLAAAVSGDRLHMIDVVDPSDPQLLSSTPLAGHGAELLLDGDRLLVLQRTGQHWGPPQPLHGEAIGAPAGAAGTGSSASGGGDRVAPGPYLPSAELTTIAMVDISDPETPRAERTWTVEGGYLSARAVDGTARIVARSNPASTLAFVYPSGPNAEEAATEANRAVIEASTIDDWVPSLTVSDADGTVTTETRVAPCDQLYRPSVFSGFGLVSVLTADMGGDGVNENDGVGVLSSGETVYASPTSLFVATNQWLDPEPDPATSEDIMPVPPRRSQRTDVHQFAIDEPGPAHYLASGSVEGRVLNQFSMSEHDGHLRIAVTEDRNGSDSASSVVVLSRDGETLDEVGRVGDLGVTEQIYAVRFMGDRGYVVTFRQIDPLYTLDLSDPADPKMLGELKIPGFSSYLHPVGQDLLVGVGQDATDDGRVTGSQVSLFDVSDPADPQRVSQLDLGEGTNSEVEHDHRAFLFWEDLAVLPFTAYRWEDGDDSMRTGAVGVDIDVEARALSERGRISHADQPSGAVGEPSTSAPHPSWERQHRSQIRRSLVVGDSLLTVSARGILSSDLDTLEPAGWSSFDG
ncbi:MAG: beta-propeller domain-containing protein [Acidimicrobiales bacterium]|nr:beta-propeller domain-containing protein [Acidimicrobiales bacterium]